MGMIDPYHWDGPVEEEPELPEDEVPSGPIRTWKEMFALAGITMLPREEPTPDEAVPLSEHYGPGNHKSGSPQSAHNMGPDAAANTAKQMSSDIATSGGTSIRTSGMTPSSGIMVSYPPGSGHNVVISTAGASEAQVQAKIEKFVTAQRSFVTNHADRYIGGWSDAGKLHLDVSRNFPSSRREQAIAAGRRQNQIAVFDLDTFTEIPTGGSGA